MKTLERIDFIRDKKRLNEWFSDEEINTALDQLGITKRDLTEERPVFAGNGIHFTPNEFLRSGFATRKHYKGAYVKETREKADIYLVPSQYQNLKIGPLVHKLLENRFSWFSSFTREVEEIIKINTKRVDLSKFDPNLKISDILKQSEKTVIRIKSLWECFGYFHNHNYEIYLSTEFGSLYVPLKALFESDFSLIEKRMHDYCSDYHDFKKLSGYALNHRGRTKEEYKKDKYDQYLKAIKPLESKEAKRLKELLIN